MTGSNLSSSKRTEPLKQLGFNCVHIFPHISWKDYFFKSRLQFPCGQLEYYSPSLFFLESEMIMK